MFGELLTDVQRLAGPATVTRGGGPLTGVGGVVRLLFAEVQFATSEGRDRP